jgi:hypothetical protein
MELEKDKNGRVAIPAEFERITTKELLPGDAVLFIYGNKLTEWHGRSRQEKFGRSQLPPYHAAMVYGQMEMSDNVLILDPVAITEFQSLQKYIDHKESRIDIVRYNLTDEQRRTCMTAAENITKKISVYDAKGYGAFISQMPFCSWFKWIVRPSPTKFYCSDAVTYCIQERAGYQISPRDHDWTAPVDIQLWAMENPDKATIRTLKNKGE